MLQLNDTNSTGGPGGGATQAFGTWKVLIYDRYCQDILSPLISVQELKKRGITLNMPLESKRQRVPEVPAVYYVQPTEENIDRICKDCKDGLYDSYYINFSSSIPRNLLEKMATLCIENDTSNKIAKVFDQYSEFVSLASNLITLNQKQSYISLNDRSAPEERIIAYIDAIVESLFSILVTMKVVPIIRCNPGTILY
jgi:sec1 family domain-containing protein 1